MNMRVGQLAGPQTIDPGNQLADKAADQITNKAAKVPENKKSEWTCVSWFNKVTKAVADKTCHFFGRLVAVVMAPFTFIPSLVCDIYKSLCDRKVSKPEAPIQNQVSAKGSKATEAETKVQPSVEENQEHKEIMSAMEASVDELRQREHELGVQNQTLQHQIAKAHQENADWSNYWQNESVRNNYNEAERQRINAENQQLNDENAEMENEITSLMSEQGELTDKFKELEKMNQHMKGLVSYIRKTNSELVAKNNRRGEYVKLLERMKEEMKDIIVEVNDENEDFAKDNRTFALEIQQLKDDAERYKDLVKSIQAIHVNQEQQGLAQNITRLQSIAREL